MATRRVSTTKWLPQRCHPPRAFPLATTFSVLASTHSLRVSYLAFPKAALLPLRFSNLHSLQEANQMFMFSESGPLPFEMLTYVHADWLGAAGRESVALILFLKGLLLQSKALLLALKRKLFSRRATCDGKFAVTLRNFARMT